MQAGESTLACPWGFSARIMFGTTRNAEAEGLLIGTSGEGKHAHEPNSAAKYRPAGLLLELKQNQARHAGKPCGQTDRVQPSRFRAIFAQDEIEDFEHQKGW